MLDLGMSCKKTKKEDCRERWRSYWREGGGNGMSPSWKSLSEADGRSNRAAASETPLRRSIIRHMFIILDLSESMQDKDFRPTR